jgi:hypothetical protein
MVEESVGENIRSEGIKRNEKVDSRVKGTVGENPQSGGNELNQINLQYGKKNCQGEFSCPGKTEDRPNSRALEKGQSGAILRSDRIVSNVVPCMTRT